MATLTQITTYQVQYSSNTFPPRIWLSNGAKPLGQLIFNPDGTVLPADTLVGGQVNLYYHLENFQHVLDLLSEEKAVYLLWAGSGPGSENGIQTVGEPLGNLPAR